MRKTEQEQEKQFHDVFGISEGGALLQRLRGVDRSLRAGRVMGADYSTDTLRITADDILTMNGEQLRTFAIHLAEQTEVHHELTPSDRNLIEARLVMRVGRQTAMAFAAAGHTSIQFRKPNDPRRRRFLDVLGLKRGWEIFDAITSLEISMQSQHRKIAAKVLAMDDGKLIEYAANVYKRVEARGHKVVEESDLELGELIPQIGGPSRGVGLPVGPDFLPDPASVTAPTKPNLVNRVIDLILRSGIRASL